LAVREVVMVDALMDCKTRRDVFFLLTPQIELDLVKDTPIVSTTDTKSVLSPDPRNGGLSPRLPSASPAPHCAHCLPFIIQPAIIARHVVKASERSRSEKVYGEAL
jgi:hypothetical protein